MGFKTWHLILASESERRRSILRSAGFEFTIFPSNSSESFSENLTLEENLCRVAEAKVETVAALLNKRKLKGTLILGADTVVVAGKQVLGKPKNRRDALRMLRLLSGKMHRVMTSVALYCPDEGRGVTRIVKTGVHFRKLTNDDMNWYVDTGEPFDKAGAYGIQGLAAQYVDRVDGDLLNVVGLPLFALKQELRRQHWNVPRRLKAQKRFPPNRRR